MEHLKANIPLSIGSFTLWNFGSKVRSRDYHYPIHTVSCGEKGEILADIWRQHTDEMLLIEGSLLNINNEKVTVEFQPSADQACQCWANNELTTGATYPSIFAKVHKTELNLIGQFFNSKWKTPNMESRREDLQKLNSFCATINPVLAPSTKHNKKLDFMASNGMRQLGESRINIFADRQKPDPFHLEVNNWEHTLNLLYRQCVQRNVVDKLVDVLKSPISKGGYGLNTIGEIF